MKQLQMTPELSAMIHQAVGPDVDTDKLSVFETIALNTKPLPGKRGTIFENAQVLPITLMQMVDHINAGNHIPLMADHELFGAPKGRFFHAGLDYGDDGLEMRALFYLDNTETNTIDKINAGSLDEVSVQFLSSQFLCSDCGWDYFSAGSQKNINDQTCANGHTIGTDGVHAELVGLNQFIELSVVARGAADKPKIVGKSESKLAPESIYRLAANGFEVDGLVVRASMRKEEENMPDNTNLTAELTAEIRRTATLTVEKSALETKLSAAETERDTLRTERDELNTKLTAAEAKNVIPADYETNTAEATAALGFFGEQFDHLVAASGKAKVEGDARPKTVAQFKAKIEELTGGLTSILPVGGTAEGVGGATKIDNDANANAKFAFGIKK